VVEDTAGANPVDEFFHPGAVPNTNNRDNAYALRVQVVEQSYDKVIKSFQGGIDTQKVSAAPYAFPKLPDVVGTRFNGEVVTKKQGSMIVIPVRNMTLKVWTESPTYLSDFNDIILPNLVFSP
jgi:hypothetical protein